MIEWLNENCSKISTRQNIPSRVFQLRKTIGKLRSEMEKKGEIPLMSMDDLLSKCAMYQSNMEDLELDLSVLCEMGSILWFGNEKNNEVEDRSDERNLSRFVILNPQWLSNVFCKIGISFKDYNTNTKNNTNNNNKNENNNSSWLNWFNPLKISSLKSIRAGDFDSLESTNLVKDGDIPSEGLNGRIEMNEIRRRLSLSDNGVVSFLIDLMKSLQIIVEDPISPTNRNLINNNNNIVNEKRFLIPALLEEKCPSDELRKRHEEACSGNVFVFERVYEISFVALGMIGRMIVRLLEDENLRPILDHYRNPSQTTSTSRKEIEVCVWKNGMIVERQFDHGKVSFLIEVIDPIISNNIINNNNNNNEKGDDLNEMKRMKIWSSLASATRQQQDSKIGVRLSVRGTPLSRNRERENKRMSQQIVVWIHHLLTNLISESFPGLKGRRRNQQIQFTTSQSECGIVKEIESQFDCCVGVRLICPDCFCEFIQSQGEKMDFLNEELIRMK